MQSLFIREGLDEPRLGDTHFSVSSYDYASHPTSRKDAAPIGDVITLNLC